MQASNVASHMKEEQRASGERRRSQRISLMVPLVVSGLSSRCKFAEYCKTLQINSYGCQIRSSRPLKAGTQVRLDVMDDNANRVTTAYVVHSELVLTEAEKDVNFWNTGLALDKPGNVWCVPSPPEDWSAADCDGDNPIPYHNAHLAKMTERAPRQAAAPPPQSPAPASAETRSAPALPLEDTDVVQRCEKVLRENELSLRRIQAITSHVAQDRGPVSHDQVPSFSSFGSDAAGPAPGSGEGSRASAQQERRTDLTEFQQEWRQRLTAIEARMAGLDARVEKAAAEFEAESRKRLHETVNEVVGRTREQLEREVAAGHESRTTAFEAEIEHALEPFISRGHAMTHDLQRLLGSLKDEQNLLETQAARLQQEKQQMQGWLVLETRRFHELAHDALVETGGQIKGRINAAIEAAQEPVERRVLEAHTQIEELAGRKADELVQRVDLSLQRLDAVRAEAAHAIHASLDAQRATVLGQFQQEAKDVTLASLAHMQATFNDALRSLSQVLQERLDLTSSKPFGANGNGGQRRTAA